MIIIMIMIMISNVMKNDIYIYIYKKADPGGRGRVPGGRPPPRTVISLSAEVRFYVFV